MSAQQYEVFQSMRMQCAPAGAGGLLAKTHKRNGSREGAAGETDKEEVKVSFKTAREAINRGGGGA